jgi:tetratricopeptide (TPR) repeat protein
MIWLLLLIVSIGSVACNRAPVPEIPLANIDPAVATQISNAVADVKRARRSADAWGKLGMALKAAAMPAEANRCFLEAEKLDPKNPRWPYFQGSIESLQRAVSRAGPDFVRLRFGQLLLEAGRSSEAEEQFRAANSALGLGQVACAQGKWEDAFRQLQTARNDKYTAQTATALLSSVCLRLGRTNEARSLSTDAAEMPPDPPWPNAFDAELKQYAVGKRAWIEQAQEALGQGDLPTAGPIIERLVTLYPAASEGWLYLGRACIIQSNLVTAEQALSRHLQLDPASVDGHLQLGLVRYRQNRLGDAASEFQAALRSKPDSENAHYFLGQIRRRLGDNEGAKQSFRDALRANPALGAARKALDELGARR